VLIDAEQISAVRVYLGVDDRQATIAGPEHEQSWRDWLALSNLLQFLGTGRFSAGTTSTPVPGSETSALRAETASSEVDTRWLPMMGAFGPAVDVIINDLARHDIPIPEPGYEACDGEFVVDLAWVEQRIAVVTDVDDGRAGALAADGWTIFGPDDPDGVLAAIGTKGDDV
jgi:hypothetical protein